MEWIETNVPHRQGRAKMNCNSKRSTPSGNLHFHRSVFDRRDYRPHRAARSPPFLATVLDSDCCAFRSTTKAVPGQTVPELFSGYKRDIRTMPLEA